jgi:hypothetical protein
MKGFISYSHADHSEFEIFLVHLRAIERAFSVRFWSDRRIDAGYHWPAAIQREIDAADVFVILVSAPFFASDYIWDNELPAIRERKKKRGEALILPVVLGPCSWQLACGVLQAVPTIQGRLKPIRRWRPREDGFDRAREQIARTLLRLCASEAEST